MFTVVPVVAAAVCVAVLFGFGLFRGSNCRCGTCAGRVGGRAWIVPASLSAAFAAFSVFVVVQEGPLGFWTEHIRNGWGNQIFIDLLLAATTALLMGAERARAAKMRLQLWVVLVIATGSIGLMAFLARLWYLERDRQTCAPTAHDM